MSFPGSKPGFTFHDKPLTRFFARWGVRGRERSRFLANWVLPTARVDRDWTDDETQLWGYTADQQQLGVDFAGIMLIGTSLSFDVQVRKIEFSVTASTGAGRSGAIVAISKVIGPYNPVVNNTGEFFPFMGGDLQPTTPRCRCIAGTAPTLNAVTIGDPPVFVSPAIGPRYFADTSNIATGVVAPLTKTILDWNDPPLWLDPTAAIFIQHINPVGLELLNVNWWVQQRRQT